ncbi:MAG: hybrid sensor histidine kinase/response regulator [Hylemonella sp.]
MSEKQIEALNRAVEDLQAPFRSASGSSALLAAGALQNAIFNSANFSLIATDDKGIIQLFNVGAERMLGYQALEVVNRVSPSDMHDPLEVRARAEALSAELGTPIAAGFEALSFKASRGIEDIYELTYLCKNGSSFPAIVSITALRDAYGDLIGYLLIGSDNSARKRAQELLKEAVTAAEGANLAKTEFLSSMSHELRTPLNAILGFAQLVASSTPVPTIAQQRSIDQILKAGWYLLELINEILDLALIESGKLIMSEEPVALADLLTECRALVESQAVQREVTLHFAAMDTPLHVKGDRTRLKQVLVNLLYNAVKYNRKPGRVDVTCLVLSPDVVRITVRDTGQGLSTEQLGKLFQPFNRLGREAGVEEGTGIGLVVTQRLVHLMGGQIGAESTPGVGSMFWVDLTRVAPAQTDPGGIDWVPAKDAFIRHGQAIQTVLYVEDNPANLELVEQIIVRYPNLRLLSAADGSTGIEFARTYLPQVILMDINLPGISGIEAMRVLHADPITARIPIIALSANAVPRDIQKGLQAGFFAYITKPIRVPELMKTLELALIQANAATAPLSLQATP